MQVLTATIGVLGQHRVWDRFPAPAQDRTGSEAEARYPNTEQFKEWRR